jgi:16S rRNA (cytosine967-C5)-methyltransferase
MHGPGSPWTAADLCAAPGGKSTHLAQLGAAVASSDVVLSRARLVAKASVRTPAVTVVVADARRPPYRPGSLDVVLLDAPCTGLGVVRRRPELRWRRTADDVARLAQLQGQLLEAAVTLVRPGGNLLYSVCTWTASETYGVVTSFLALNGDLVETVDTPTGGRGSKLGDRPGVQLDPDLDGTDGMFLCRFRRRA